VGGALYLTNLNPSIHMLLETTWLLKVIKFQDAEEDAIRACAAEA
jgi:anti-anti-sigma regulatory factor